MLTTDDQKNTGNSATCLWAWYVFGSQLQVHHCSDYQIVLRKCQILELIKAQTAASGLSGIRECCILRILMPLLSKGLTSFTGKDRLCNNVL